MIGWIFKGLAALAVLAAVTYWWGPETPDVPHLALGPPAEVGGEPTPDAAPARSPSPPEHAAPTPSADRVPESAPVPTPAVAPREPSPAIGDPSLDEEELLVVERPDFEEGPAAGVAALPPGPDAEPDPGDPTARAAPVDVERSGDLIRRMLDLYAAMRE
jgi:hypothetical protein